MAKSFETLREEEESKETENSSSFLSCLYRTIEEGKENTAMQFIYKYFYNIRMRKDYKLCDRILRDVDEQRLDPFLLVTILTITAPLKQFLNQRIPFYSKAKKAISALHGSEKTERTLIGLE